MTIMINLKDKVIEACFRKAYAFVLSFVGLRTGIVKLVFAFYMVLNCNILAHNIYTTYCYVYLFTISCYFIIKMP